MGEPLDRMTQKAGSTLPHLACRPPRPKARPFLQKGDCFSVAMTGRGARIPEHHVLLRMGTEDIRGLHIPIVHPTLSDHW